jgi:heme exporter protein A
MRRRYAAPARTEPLWKQSHTSGTKTMSREDSSDMAELDLSGDSPPNTRSGEQAGSGGGQLESAAMIRARKLQKRYGEKRVLRGVEFELAQDGFLVVTGPNGSGKTTLLRLCAGLAAPSGGELDVDVHRGRIGYLGHEPLVYAELNALENLELYGRLYRVPERRERSGMLLERFGLWDARHERVSGYSRGMLQRLALCRVLLHEPGLLVLDEPYSALDAEGATLLDRELEERRSHAAFVVATHDPARVERFASARLALA